jgi:3-dehydroquinate synthase
MELTFSVTHTTKVGFAKSFADFAGSLGHDCCFLIDRSLESLAGSLPNDRLFYIDGEKEKDLNHVESCLEWLIDLNAGRRTTLVAVGGGATTDFAAFTASVYKRGMRLVLVPTTLLSAVDSSIGGKTAVNFVAKNTVGTFYPADEVVIMEEFFKTLTPQQVASGKAEIIKLALIKGGKLADMVFAADDLLSEEAITLAILGKYEIVSADFTDTLEKRIVLNWGHTFGHAIEIYYALPHGMAVAAGMVLVQEWAETVGAGEVFPAKELEKLLQKHGVKNDLQKYRDENKWRKFIMLDKKRNLDRISMVYLKKTGVPGIIYRNSNDILRDLEELR